MICYLTEGCKDDLRGSDNDRELRGERGMEGSEKCAYERLLCSFLYVVLERNEKEKQSIVGG